MDVQDAMTTAVVTVSPDATLQEAAAAMVARNVGSAIVVANEHEVRGIVTERDVLQAVAGRSDCAASRVADHVQSELRQALPDWPLQDAAAEMLRGGFRHLVVSRDGHQLVGVLSMRDIVRIWAAERLQPM